MAKAANALSLPDDDCNDDPGQEHFDTTLTACGDAVARLINSSPRTPTAEQITHLIRTALREGFDSAPDGEEGDAEALNFGPVLLELDEDDLNYRLTSYRFALSVLGQDDAGLREKVQRLVGLELAGKLEPDVLDRLVLDLEICEEKFGAMAHFAQVAKARLGVAAMKIAGVTYVPDGGLTKAVLQAGGHRP